MSSALVPKNYFNFDNTKHISLDELASGVKNYDRMPTVIHQALEHSVWLTVITNVVCIPLMFFAPALLAYFYPVESNFFYFTGDLFNLVFSWCEYLSSFLLITNAVCLVAIVIVLISSWAMTKAVREEFHWLAWFAAIPTGISAFSVALTIGLTIVLLLITLVIWLAIIGIILGILYGFAESLFD